MNATAKTYICRIGFSHEPASGKHRRFEPGEHVAGLPARVRDQLAKDGVVELVNAADDEADA